jgi:hypothetical protein
MSNLSPLLDTDTGKKIILSDLEKQRKKEENARRRKLQMDQKMENDRVSFDFFICGLDKNHRSHSLLLGRMM